jgi:hypothetical protein
VQGLQAAVLGLQFGQAVGTLDRQASTSGSNGLAKKS